LISCILFQNERLRRELQEERQGIGNFLEDLSEQKNRANQSVAVLEKEVNSILSIHYEFQREHIHFFHRQFIQNMLNRSI
jgi:hypothetical protein